MYAELARYDRERRALLVPCGCEDNRFVGHLADHPPTRNSQLVEVVDDRGPVDLVPSRERVDRRAVSIEADQCVDLGRRQPSLHRV